MSCAHIVVCQSRCPRRRCPPNSVRPVTPLGNRRPRHRKCPARIVDSTTKNAGLYAGRSLWIVAVISASLTLAVPALAYRRQILCKWWAARPRNHQSLLLNTTRLSVADPVICYRGLRHGKRVGRVIMPGSPVKLVSAACGRFYCFALCIIQVRVPLFQMPPP